VNPQNFRIIDGKLYLSWSEDGSSQFAKNANENIEKAKENWVMAIEKK
jgi:hypothetical protein